MMDVARHIIGKTQRIRLSVVILFSFLTLGCGKVSHNGDLDGMWRVVSIENIATGEVMYPAQHFYCFNLHTANLTKGPVYATANMIYNYPSLILDFPYNQQGDLDEWGIYGNNVRFEILQLTSSELIMRSDESLITLKKF